MLLPKRVKHRRVQRGRMTGKAMRGNKVSYGDFGLVALEPAWITANQIEAARIAMTRYIKRGGQVWIKIFPDKPVNQVSPLKPAWVPVKVLPSIGLPLLSPAESCLRSPVLIRSSQKRLCVLLLTSSPSSANL